MSDANEFIAWMKSNKSNSHSNFQRSDAQDRNQSIPYVIYSTLVFMYEWESNEDSQGNVYYSNFRCNVRDIIQQFHVLKFLFSLSLL